MAEGRKLLEHFRKGYVDRELWMKSSRGTAEQHVFEVIILGLALGSSTESPGVGSWVACLQSVLPLG